MDTNDSIHITNHTKCRVCVDRRRDDTALSVQPVLYRCLGLARQESSLGDELPRRETTSAAVLG
jgi:hypothetical protein